MKKLLLIILETLIVLPALARDFTYTYDGQTLKYTVIDEAARTCEVAAYYNSVSGNLVIRAIAKDGNNEYSVTSIGESAFMGCSALKSVEIPNSVSYIANYAFTRCTGLTSMNIPPSVTSICEGAFCNCSGLNSIEIPNSVTSIGDGAFAGCSSLTSVAIPNSVISIGDGAFAGCSSLTSVDIPNSVTSIANYAFARCSSLTSVTIPSSVTSIDNSAFADCTGLTSVNIPNSVTSIGDKAFSWCRGLTTVTIPTSVISIGYWAFSACFSLTSIEVSPENPNYASLDGVLFNKNLTTLIQFPEGKFANYEIPCSVINIGISAFEYCSGLTSVNIPNSVTSIGTSAFEYCNGLSSVYYGADEPIEGSSNIFSESMYENATLYMSEKGIVKGRTIDPWKNFAKIEVYAPTEGIDAVDADIDFNQPCEVYSLSGAKVGNTTENLAPGIYIIRQGNAVKKIVVKKI